MDESKNEKPREERRLDPELLKKGLRCDLDQYKRLKECSEKGAEGIKKWNERCRDNPGEDILLEGANLNKRYLKGINLKFAYMKGAYFRFSHLEEANLWTAHLEGTELLGSHLQGAKIKRAYLQGADFMDAEVNVHTVIRNCQVDRETDFRMVAVDSIRIDSATKQLLEYNIRRKNWEEWYKKQHWLLRCLVRKFWQISDYGISTKRIIFTFFWLALLFAAIYANFACWYPPGIVSDLTVEPHLPLWHYFLLLLLRPIYFSVVTMTTLGFGDMYANAQSILGHLLLTVQVILGYVLLGALVTRFAVLFTAGGPAGEFAEEK